jgi:hypothetical protein
VSEPTAQRTLVKSPPELWAELSDVECLARHLGEFGEIRITRVEPETTVVWEGERASGTVELEPSGWGTKVTLKATPKDEPPAPAPPAAVAPPPEPEPEPVAPPEPEPVAVAPEPVAPEPAPEPEPEPVPAPVSANELLAKSGFFSRMFGRKKADEPAAEIGGPSAPAPEPAPPTPTPDPMPPVSVPDPEPPAPAPDPEPPLPEPTPIRQPERDPGPPDAAEAPLDYEGVLTGVLDTLGAAHHRPFSRG